MHENKTVTFHCAATGNPTPKITWTKDGKTVGTGSKLTFVALRSLAGQYWCSADNGLSAGVKANAYLHVLCKYQPKIILDDLSSDQDRQILTED